MDCPVCLLDDLEACGLSACSSCGACENCGCACPVPGRAFAVVAGRAAVAVPADQLTYSGGVDLLPDWSRCPAWAYSRAWSRVRVLNSSGYAELEACPVRADRRIPGLGSSLAVLAGDFCAILEADRLEAARDSWRALCASLGVL